MFTNPKRYGWDKFVLSIPGFIAFSHQLDLKDIEAISFLIDYHKGAEDKISLLFLTGGNCYKIENNQLIQLDIVALNAEEILDKGNTVEEISTMENITCLANKQIQLAFALSSEGDSSECCIKSFSVLSRSCVYESPSFESERNFLVKNITLKAETSDHAYFYVFASVKRSDGIWSKYIPLSSLITKVIRGVKYKVYCNTEMVNDIVDLDKISLKGEYI